MNCGYSNNYQANIDFFLICSLTLKNYMIIKNIKDNNLLFSQVLLNFCKHFELKMIDKKILYIFYLKQVSKFQWDFIKILLHLINIKNNNEKLWKISQ